MITRFLGTRSRLQARRPRAAWASFVTGPLGFSFRIVFFPPFFISLSVSFVFFFFLMKPSPGSRKRNVSDRKNHSIGSFLFLSFFHFPESSDVRRKSKRKTWRDKQKQKERKWKKKEPLVFSSRFNRSGSDGILGSMESNRWNVKQINKWMRKNGEAALFLFRIEKRKEERKCAFLLSVGLFIYLFTFFFSDFLPFSPPFLSAPRCLFFFSVLTEPSSSEDADTGRFPLPV